MQTVSVIGRTASVTARNLKRKCCFVFEHVHDALRCPARVNPWQFCVGECEHYLVEEDHHDLCVLRQAQLRSTVWAQQYVTGTVSATRAVSELHVQMREPLSFSV